MGPVTSSGWAAKVRMLYMNEPIPNQTHGRPVAWSRSSVIYSAHPTQPTVVARHFPSSRQFVVPSSTSILENLAAYEPPTVISISPSEDWLFAYFPAHGCDGIGCLWERGSQLDHWEVREQFHYERGAGVVTAEWTSSERPVSVRSTYSSLRTKLCL